MFANPTPPLSIVIPTRGRAPVLARTLEALAADSPAQTEVIVAGPGDDRESEAVTTGAGARWLACDQDAGPGRARNAAVGVARSDLILFCDDDVRPVAGMADAHLRFHSGDPDPLAALMGLVRPEPPLDRSRFQRWLHERGIQFAYGLLSPGPVSGRYLWVANASFKRAGLERVGGFDEAIGFGSEDADLGERFVAAGGTITYEPGAEGLHHRPTTFAATLGRMHHIGVQSRDHPARLAKRTRPRPTSAAHRAWIALLSGLAAAGLLRGPLEPAAWRALCKQAYREGWWDEGPSPLRVGSGLAARIGRRVDPAASETAS